MAREHRGLDDEDTNDEQYDGEPEQPDGSAAGSQHAGHRHATTSIRTYRMTKASAVMQSGASRPGHA
jgi:hypothetical protein